MANSKFQLVFPENQKKDTNLPTTDALAFDDLGDFIEERERVKREAQRLLNTDLRVDYSNFANHVFFDSALSKLDIAKSRMLNQYPFAGNREEKDAFHLTGSGYEKYVFDQWPRDVSYVDLDSSTNQHITASDTDNKLMPGTSSFYMSAWINPFIDPTFLNAPQYILTYISGTDLTADKFIGFLLQFEIPSAGDDPEVRFVAFSGAVGDGYNATTVSASYAGFSASFNNIAGAYDSVAGSMSLYINDQKVDTAPTTVSYGSFEFVPQIFQIGTGSLQFGGSSFGQVYSGSIDEVRVAHTASDLWHRKNYSRPITAEDYVKLYYKFNEGFVGTSSIDEVVVDYSKSGLHGKYLNYTVDSSRISGSSMDNDPGDPILYNFHTRVMDFTGSIELSASVYDNNNNNQITNLVPEVLLTEDDNTDGLYLSFLLAMSRFFDEVKLSIDQFDNLRITNYAGVNDTPDLFLPAVQRYFGWKVTEHFGDANPLALFFGENILSSGSLETPLIEVKNQFWRRVLNNLPYLLKTKGKRHNLDSFFNVLGINRENITLKEYGYLPGTSIQDERIHKEKVTSLLGIGTGSFGVLSSSFVKMTASLLPFPLNWDTPTTIETLVQLPFVSASYSGTLTTGSIWQFVDPEQVTGSFSLVWNIPAIGSTTGKFILTGSDGQSFSSSDMEVFDGDFAHIAAGFGDSRIPFITVRTIDNDEIDFSSSDVGVTALSGIFTASKFDFVMGANSGSVFSEYETQGFYGEYRLWGRELSGSELDDHALHFESVGVLDPGVENITGTNTGQIVAHWALNEDLVADANGEIGPIPDLSRLGRVANGAEFPASENPYQKFLVEYNYLSPSIDLKWSENKIRIRNKTELTIDDVATDTNEMSLEFNLVESLNEDITKIFSTFEILNDLIGKPVNKYRDEYSDLESVRREYFERMGDSIHFTNFFKLFKWFDRKLSDSIKHLLPARVRFIGGEQVVESHVLERPKYAYKYPMFRTPQDVPEMTLRGTTAESKRDADFLHRGFSSASFGLSSDPGDSVVVTEGDKMVATQDLPPETTFYFNDKDTQNYLTSSAPISLVSVEAAKIAGTPLSVFRDGINEGEFNRPSYRGTIGQRVEVLEFEGDDASEFERLFDIDVDSSGALYAVGRRNNVGVREWVTRKGHISGSAWTTIDAVLTASGSIQGEAVVVDPQDNIYTCGTRNLTGSVKYSNDKGATWIEVDATASDTGAGFGAGYFGLAAHPTNDQIVYVVGLQYISGSDYQFLVRRTTDGGSTWSTVYRDNISTGSIRSRLDNVAVDTDGKVYVVGSEEQDDIWTILTSSDGSSGSWAVVDTDQGDGSAYGGVFGEALDVAIGKNGWVYVVGEVDKFPGAIMKVSYDRGATWQEVELNYEGTSGGSTIQSVHVNDEGVFIAGQDYDANQILVRAENEGINLQMQPSLFNPNNYDLNNAIWAMTSWRFSSGSMLLIATEQAGVAGPHIVSATRLDNLPLPTKTKNSGDSEIDENDPNSGVNFRNEHARKVIMKRDRDNEG